MLSIRSNRSSSGFTFKGLCLQRGTPPPSSPLIGLIPAPAGVRVWCLLHCQGNAPSGWRRLQGDRKPRLYDWTRWVLEAIRHPPGQFFGRRRCHKVHYVYRTSTQKDTGPSPNPRRRDERTLSLYYEDRRPVNVSGYRTGICFGMHIRHRGTVPTCARTRYGEAHHGPHYIGRMALVKGCGGRGFPDAAQWPRTRTLSSRGWALSATAPKRLSKRRH